MKRKIQSFTFILFILQVSNNTFSQTLLMQESFETSGEGSRYTSNTFYTALHDYFTRMDNTVATYGLTTHPTNPNGSFYWGAEDNDVASGGEGVITFNAVTFTGYNILDVDILLAVGRPDDFRLEIEDYIIFEYNADGAGWNKFGAFYGNNGVPRGNLQQDTDLDGSYNAAGLEINSSNFTDVNFRASVSGTSLQVRVRVLANTGSEEIVFDNLRINGDVAVAADATPPVFESITPSSSSITQTGFTLATDIDEVGTIYYVVVANGATAPTSANVKAAQASGAGTPVTSGNAAVTTGGFSNNFGVTGLSAGTAYDVYAVAQDDEGSPNLQTSPTKIDVTTAAPSSLLVAATVFLEGAHNGTGLNTGINTSIPTTQPYSNNGHSGGATMSVPAGAVDWVLVELREAGSAAAALNNTRRGSSAGFLMSNGTIKATDGISNLSLSLSGNSGTDYFVVIYHRNHLPIMSANAVAGSSGTLTIDFTSSSATTFQTTTALVSLSGGKFGMPAGDTNDSGTIDATDLSTWSTNNGLLYNYSGNGVSDFNLDGVINAVDRNDFHQKNTGKTRQVPST